MKSLHVHKMYRAVCPRVLSNEEDTIVCNDQENDLPRSIVGFFHGFSDKPSSTLTSSVFFLSNACLVHQHKPIKWIMACKERLRHHRVSSVSIS